MCGIFALLNTNNIDKDEILEQFEKGKRRGPEYSKLDNSYLKMSLGFHRLAINGLNTQSNQPIVFNDVILICNGEIYNYKQLYEQMNIIPTTDSDCEVIIHLFIKYGIEQTLLMIDGVYAFVLYDNRITEELTNNIYIARDPFGVRPLYKIYNINDNYNLYGFASELKCLEHFYNSNIEQYKIEQFEPGTYSVFEYGDKIKSKWEPKIENKIYIIPTFSYTRLIGDNMDIDAIIDFKEEIFNNISKYY
jgi:asparagine synthase (glutamine-hydrolysing)